MQWFSVNKKPPSYQAVLCALDDPVLFEMLIAYFTSTSEWIPYGYGGKNIWDAIGKSVKYWTFLPSHPDYDVNQDSNQIIWELSFKSDGHKENSDNLLPSQHNPAS